MTPSRSRWTAGRRTVVTVGAGSIRLDTKIVRWASKCAEVKHRGGRIALLVPASVGANWFKHYVDQKAFWLALNGRLAFLPDKPSWMYPKDCLLALYAPELSPGYEVWTWPPTGKGRIIRAKNERPGLRSDLAPQQPPLPLRSTDSGCTPSPARGPHAAW